MLFAMTGNAPERLFDTQGGSERRELRGRGLAGSKGMAHMQGDLPQHLQIVGIFQVALCVQRRVII